MKIRLMKMQWMNQRMKGLFLNIALLGGAFFFFLSAGAKVKLPTILSDGMVLQRERPVVLWGTADRGETVTVELFGPKQTKRGKSYTTTADEQGKWQVELPAMKAGGPYRFLFNGEVTLQDVLVGDVWLCSGQSNMELPVRRVTDRFAEEIADYRNDQIRQIKVPNRYNFRGAQEDIAPAAWQKAEQPGVMEFSALAYFFAKAYYEKSGVPVGLVNSSWGGTPVESWMSEEALQAFPRYLHDKWQVEDDAYVQQVIAGERKDQARWDAALYRGDEGLKGMPWYRPELPDADWQEVDLFSTQWNNNGLNPVNGAHWFRKHIQLSADWQGEAATLRMGCIVDADSVFVNGTFVGTVSYQYPPRIYQVPAGVLKAGENVITVRLLSKNGYAQFVPEKLYKLIGRPGEVSLEGTWKYRLGSEMPEAPSTTFFNYKPEGLYNAMIAPLQRLAFKGVLWYQGEANVSRRNEYAALLTAMMADWRKTFRDESLPFYLVELADFLPKEDVAGRTAWAEFRMVQAATAQQNERAWLIPNEDLGEWNDIHPLDKKTLGQRVADQAWKLEASQSMKKK